MESSAQGEPRGRAAGVRRFALALAMVAAAAVAVAATGLDSRRLTVWVVGWRAFAATHGAEAALLYFAAYVAFAALSLPGAWALSLAGGALFGLWLGFPLALASSAAGATLAMMIARYLLRDAAAARFPGLVAKANAGIARHGARWVVAARLTPVIPFFAVNIAVGLTRMPAFAFAAASLIGSIPVALLTVLAGAKLATAAGPADVLSPATTAILIALGAATLTVGRWRAR